MSSDSASLMVHRDTTSIATQITDRLSKLSVAFSFDREVFTSNVYARFFRGLTKRVLRHPQIDWLTQSANPYPTRPIRTLGWIGIGPDPIRMDMDA
jgi:hypothetical protein